MNTLGLWRPRWGTHPLISALVMGMAWTGTAGADNTAPHVMSQPQETDAATAAAIADYWTPERMAAALPRDVSYATSLAPSAEGVPLVPPALPPGAMPGSGPLDLSARSTYRTAEDITDFSQPAGPASSSYPSAHTTYEFQGRYRTWPRSPVGKLFFSLNGGSWVCSAALIGYRHVVTAGHCVSDGDTTWAENVMFCPSYDIGQGGANPAVGCWTTNTLTTTTRWHTTGEPDADLGMAIYGTNGTVHNDYPGYVTGWLGYSWNFGVGQHEEMFGYPAADRVANAHNEYADFNGGKIYVTSAEEAGYTANWGTYHDSKFLGTLQTPGCSGGPWIFRYGKKYVDSWNNNWVNGVNSHQRCWDANPPCADRYMEISSPQFIAYTEDGDCSLPNCGVVDLIHWTFGVYP